MKYRTGLVVGKFSPLHYGHEYLIGTALNKCDKVIVLSYTDPEFKNCEAAERRIWLADRFPTVRSLVIEPGEFYSEGTGSVKVPKNDDSEESHREFCANILLNHLETTVDAVFSSEEYGAGFAEYLTLYFKQRVSYAPTVQNVCVDIEREFMPISGTKIRSDNAYLTSYTSSVVRSSFAKRIVLLGGESSGKTTLALALAERLKAPVVLEYGREYCDKLGDLSRLRFEDLEVIGRTQIERERKAAHRNPGGFVICDTSPLTTAFYSREMFNRVSRELRKMALREYDFTFICDPNIPFVHEPMRVDEAFRRKGFFFYTTSHDSIERPYKVVYGTVEERVEQVLKYIKD